MGEDGFDFGLGGGIGDWEVEGREVDGVLGVGGVDRGVGEGVLPGGIVGYPGVGWGLCRDVVGWRVRFRAREKWGGSHSGECVYGVALRLGRVLRRGRARVRARQVRAKVSPWRA